MVSLALASLIYYYVSIKGKAGDWGDGFKSAYFQLALRSLRSLGGMYFSIYISIYSFKFLVKQHRTAFVLSIPCCIKTSDCSLHVYSIIALRLSETNTI